VKEKNTMKEKTKYNNYRFVGKINVDEIQPWFDFDKAKPWDEMDVPWVLENKVRREILIRLARGPKSFEELYKTLNFSPKPLLIEREEHVAKVRYQWTKDTIENHLLSLEWYDLIKKEGGTYHITIPVLPLEKAREIEQYVSSVAEKWAHIVKEIKDEAREKFKAVDDKKSPLFSVLIEKAVEQLYEVLKEEGILPDEPNIKTLWAEQLRKIKFEAWVAKNF
jgi:hypothetical protein